MMAIPPVDDVSIPKSASLNNPCGRRAGGGTLEPLEDYLGRMIADYELTPLGWIRTQTAGLSAKKESPEQHDTYLF